MRAWARVWLALWLAAWGHRRQKDKGGRAYLWHLATVAWVAFGLTRDPEAVVVGLLHDYLEDVDHSVRSHAMVRRGFGTATLKRLQTLQRGSSAEYAMYVQEIADCNDRTVIAVKLADLLHNSDRTRRMTLTEARGTLRIGRQTHYLNALNHLLKIWATGQVR